MQQGLLQAICPSEDILLQSYYDDRARAAIVFFESKEIDLCELKLWQQKYPIIFPWDPTYNTVRMNYNKDRQFFPVMIIAAHKQEDVRFGLELTKRLCVNFRLRAGGHDWFGYSLINDIVIDVTGINHINLDLEKETITVGSGVRIGQVVDKLSEFGYVLPAGTCQNVGVCGLSLGGGIGFLERKFGLTLDSMLSTKVLLADGRIVNANNEENCDLFWAMRGGGGGSLGVNLEFTFRIYKLEKVVLFEMWFAKDELRKVLKYWQNWAPFVDRRLTAELNIFSKKELCVADSSARGKTQFFPVNVTGQFVGTEKELEEHLEDLISYAEEIRIWTTTPREAAIHYATPFPKSFQFFRNLFAVEKLTDKMVCILNDFIDRAPEGISIEINALQGELLEMAHDDTAFAWRDAIFWILIKGYTNEQEELYRISKYVRWIYDQFLKNGLTNPETGVGRLYVNFKDPELSKEKYPLAYWGNNAEKLSEIKTKYDPENFFRFQQSIPLA